MSGQRSYQWRIRCYLVLDNHVICDIFEHMNSKELEELIYDYGETMKHIGRCETNDASSTKEYNKLISHKETITKKFDEYFKTNVKLSKALGIF